MPSSVLRVGTRGSTLALTQTGLAVEALRSAAEVHGVELEVEVVRITTSGDRITDKPFEDIGPKGVFAKELERALLDAEIDVAVHSLKDLPSDEPEGLVIAAVLEREDARDVLVSRGGALLADLAPDAVIGTSSSRRRALLGIVRPDLRTVPLRGNVDTRLEKIRNGEMDAGVLAGAGLVRLSRQEEITEWLDPMQFVPAPGQGALAIEVRTDRAADDLAWIGETDHSPTRNCIEAERAFMRGVEGGCEVPLGAWARTDGDEVICEGFLSSSDGTKHIRDATRGRNPQLVGTDLARRFLEAGAGDLTARG
jgi:hydroxymethylbilane synthase